MDRHIRYPNDPLPLRPNRLLGARNPNRPETMWDRRRYARWTRADDPDVRLVRSCVQEEGRGLFVLELHDGSRALVEAYYPDEMTESWIKRKLDPLREADMRMGRLTVVSEELVYSGELDRKIIVNLRKNNRNARRHLKRKLSAYDKKAARREAEERSEQEDWDRFGGDEWSDMYVEAHLDAMKFARDNPRVVSTGIPNKEG